MAASVRKENFRLMLSKELFAADEQLRISVANLFAAGTETTTTTLLWGFIYMIEYPEIQRKVQKEIDEHVGRRPIRSEDRGKQGTPTMMSFINAFSYTFSIKSAIEIHRCGNVGDPAVGFDSSSRCGSYESGSYGDRRLRYSCTNPGHIKLVRDA